MATAAAGVKRRHATMAADRRTDGDLRQAMTEQKSGDILLWLVALGVFMQMLDSTIVNTALPAMAASLDESPLRMQSVVIAYALTMAMLIPASGWLADRFGTRRVFVCAIAVFATGSLLCAQSHSLAQLAASRVVQGVGGSMLLPVGRLAVLRSFPRGQFLRAITFVTVPGLVGRLIGPTLGGWLVETASWHWIFLINLPVGIAAGLATLRYMPDARRTVGRFDLGGYLMLSFSMVAISLSLDGLSELGLRHATVLMLLIFGMASFVAYWLHATRAPSPLFPLALFRVHTYRVGVLGNLFARLGSGSMPFLIPLMLQVGLGYSALDAGLMMIPLAVAGLFSKRCVVAIVREFGLPIDTRPIVIGYSSGATIVYAALAEDAGRKLGGGVSLGFCPDLLIRKPFCPGSGGLTQKKQQVAPFGYVFDKRETVQAPWRVLQGEADEVCDPKFAPAFVEGQADAKAVMLPKVGHGFGVPKNWMAQYRDSVREVLEAKH